MIIGIEATFKELNKAKKAYQSIEKNINDLEKLQVLTVDKIEDCKKSRYKNHINKLMTRTAIGGVIGCVAGALTDFIVNFSGISSNYQNYFQSLFILVGAVAGMMCAILIHYISKEHDLAISVSDMKKSEALIIVKVDKEEMQDVIDILNSTNAESIHTI